jgi:DNA (cytosine-5)-methyltransferase 1
MANDSRNSLVAKAALFVEALAPDVVMMENAREVLTGNFPEHFEAFSKKMASLGYLVKAEVHRLDRFGLPQIRERSLVIAVRKGKGRLRTITDLWEGAFVIPKAITVKRALDFKPRTGDLANRYPAFQSPEVKSRIEHIPRDGGSWFDLTKTTSGRKCLTPAMLRILDSGKIGSHPDVYGRMAWDRPAPTIKRECAHIGNGRYAHPEESRLLTVREMATLQGFPQEFKFGGTSLANLYRHIGDAVPPLISHQLSHVAYWILTGRKPALEDTLLKGTHLRKTDLDHCLV